MTGWGTGHFKRRRYFVLLGCCKNYIMYWGGYVYYNNTLKEISVHKPHKNCMYFLLGLHIN